MEGINSRAKSLSATHITASWDKLGSDFRAGCGLVVTCILQNTGKRAKQLKHKTCTYVCGDRKNLQRELTCGSRQKKVRLSCTNIYSWHLTPLLLCFLSYFLFATTCLAYLCHRCIFLSYKHKWMVLDFSNEKVIVAPTSNYKILLSNACHIAVLSQESGPWALPTTTGQLVN